MREGNPIVLDADRAVFCRFSSCSFASFADNPVFEF